MSACDRPLLITACLQLGSGVPDSTLVHLLRPGMNRLDRVPLCRHQSSPAAQRARRLPSTLDGPTGGCVYLSQRVCRRRRCVGIRWRDRWHVTRPVRTAGLVSGGCRNRKLPDVEVGEDGRAQRGVGQRTGLHGHVHTGPVRSPRLDLGEDHRSGDRMGASGAFERAGHTGRVGDRARRPGWATSSAGRSASFRSNWPRVCCHWGTVKNGHTRAMPWASRCCRRWRRSPCSRPEGWPSAGRVGNARRVDDQSGGPPRCPRGLGDTVHPVGPSTV